MESPCNYLDAFLGERVRRARVFRGWGLGELASRLNLSASELRAREDGLIRFGARELRIISQALTVPVGFFFEGFKESMQLRAPAPPLRLVERTFRSVEQPNRKVASRRKP